MNEPTVILDADGVFLSERPYWNTALRTAMSLGGIVLDDPAREDRLAATAFEVLGLQQVTKRRGCNSNWDLAAVLTTSLQQPDVYADINLRLERAEDLAALQRLKSAAEARWVGTACRAYPVDPLSGFGVDRESSMYTEVQRTFQQALARTPGSAAVTDELRRALHDLSNFGFRLGICTGRPRAELEAPLKSCRLIRLFDPRNIVTACEVAEVEQAMGRSGLQKPHWFPLVLACCGRDVAVRMIDASHAALLPVRCIYVGDAQADFTCVTAASRKGLAVRYVHVRSGLTDDDDERRIGDWPRTLAVVDTLAEVPAILEPMEKLR